MIRTFIILIVLLISICIASAAEESKPASSLLAPTGPLVIKSDSLKADGRAGTAVFSGSVVATGDDLYMSADIMRVKYAKSGGALEQIIAEGSVKLVRSERVVTSEHVVYSALARTMVFTGSPRVVEGSNVLIGTKIVYMLDEDVYEVEGSKIFIDNTPAKEPG